MKKKKQIKHRSTDAEGHPHHTDTAGGPDVQTGDSLRHSIVDGGDVRDHEARMLPPPQGGDMWGAQPNAPAPQVSAGGPMMAPH